jgi:hypothetical protein
MQTIAGMVDPTAIGAALASTHNVKTYYALSQISASLGTTPRLQDVWTAMPQYSLLICPSTLFDAQDMPSANYGTVEMYKGITVSSGFIEFHGRNATTASANFIKRPNTVGTTGPWEQISGIVLQASVQTISAAGTTSYTLTGLTADHVVDNWGMFSDAACTTPIPENAPNCNILITTAADSWSCTVSNFSATFYLRPTFILKQN